MCILWIQEAAITFYLRQSWTDPRLAFQPSGSVPSQIRLFDWDKIWVPDTFFRLETYSYVHMQTVPNKLLRLKNTGELWYVMKYVSSLYCFYLVISIQYTWDDIDVIRCTKVTAFLWEQYRVEAVQRRQLTCACKLFCLKLYMVCKPI